MVHTIYDGELVHTRRDRWASRTFRYRFPYVALDLDTLAGTRTFSIDRPNLFELRTRDSRVADGPRSLADAVRALVPAERITLVTQLRTLGAGFNPVSFFLAGDAAVLEINNTYGGHRIHVARRDGALPRDFVVSPFIQGQDLSYRLRLDGPDSLGIDVHRGGERFFVSHLRGRRPRPLSDRALLATLIRHPLQPVRTLALIHYQAMKLHHARVPYRRP